MKFSKILIMSLLLIHSSKSVAQITRAYGMDSPSFVLESADITKYETLDSCYLTVSYLFGHRASEKDDSLSYEDLMDLQAGRNYNAFFSKNLREHDKEIEELKKTTRYLPCVPDECVGFDLIFNHSDSTTSETNRIPFTTQMIEYSERTENPKWIVNSEDTDTVMGYKCISATCNFRGRKWKVWFTPEIPLPYGPWKLNGTDGLILKATDTDNNFKFEAVGLSQKNEPIIRYEWKRKEMSRKDWKRFERDMHENAGAFANRIGIQINIIDNSERGFHKQTGDWSIFYNPLEF